MKPLLPVLFAMLLWPASAGADPLEARDAWVRQPPPGANAAGYLTLRNRGARPRTLVGVHSESAERVEIHESAVEEGVARMRAVEAIEIPPGSEISLAPRGLHLMLIAPKPLGEGDLVPLVLELDGGETQEVSAKVRQPEQPDAPHTGHH